MFVLYAAKDAGKMLQHVQPDALDMEGSRATGVCELPCE
jgi:hypothetical protein